MRDGYGFIWTAVSIPHLNTKSRWKQLNEIRFRAPPKKRSSLPDGWTSAIFALKNLDCTISGMLNDIRRSKDYQAHGIG